jgi:hypothetical protein
METVTEEGHFVIQSVDEKCDIENSFQEKRTVM